MTNGKCYSKPTPAPKTAIDRQIDSAFEKAYRSVYMGQDSMSEGKQLIEDAYQRSMERKRNASKPVEDDAGQLSEAAQSSYRRNLPAEDADPVEAAYQRKMQRLQEGN